MEKGRAWIGRDADVSRAGWMVYVKAAGRREEVQVQKQVPPSSTGAGGGGCGQHRELPRQTLPAHREPRLGHSRQFSLAGNAETWLVASCQLCAS